MRKNPFITFYSIVVVFIFAGILLFSGISLGKEYKKGEAQSSESFNKVTREVKTLLNSSQIPSSTNLTASGNVSFSDYAYVNVKINRQDAVLFPQNAQEPIDNNKFSKVQRETFNFGDNTIYVCANVYVLSPSVIAYYCKLSFIVILIFTVLTILIIVIKGLSESDEIFESNEEVVDGFDYETTEEKNESEEVTVETVTEEKDEESKPEETAKEELDVSEYKEAIILPVDFSEIPSTIAEPEPAETEKEEVPVEASKTEDDSEQSAAEAEPEFPSEDAPVEEVPVEETPAEEVQASEPAPLPVADYLPEESNPVGLYSEKTGFGWESYLKPRLENELIRATSSEFDLCLFIVKIADLSKDAPETKKIAEILLSFFQFKDMVFEYKDDSYAAIKTNLTIDDAIKTADNLYGELTEVLKETSAKCYIGLSSKTIRMVGAERILKEADAAVEHAQEDPECPIIAFRANAEKYMEFVEKN